MHLSILCSIAVFKMYHVVIFFCLGMQLCRLYIDRDAARGKGNIIIISMLYSMALPSLLL